MSESPSNSITQSRPIREDLFVTTPLRSRTNGTQKARELAAELNAVFVPREDRSLAEMFSTLPGTERCLVVQTTRLLLVHRDGAELFYHPNMAALRLNNLSQGGRDLLLEAGELKEGDSVLDCTLGYASEAILCAHFVGETGEVHGIESVPELGLVVREGLRTVTTENRTLNAAMRRVQVVYLGHHLDFLRACPSGRYDVVCFDPFFGEVLERSVHMMVPLRVFGDDSRLFPEAVAEAARVARRRVLVKSERWSPLLKELGITEQARSRHGKVMYGIVPAQSTIAGAG